MIVKKLIVEIGHGDQYIYTISEIIIDKIHDC